MIIRTYSKNEKWKRDKCDRCGKYRWLCQHHIDRKRNSDRVVWICSNGMTGVLYPDACHQWIHENPAKAKLEGYYNELDSEYRPRKSNPSKWKLKKGIANIS